LTRPEFLPVMQLSSNSRLQQHARARGRITDYTPVRGPRRFDLSGRLRSRCNAARGGKKETPERKYREGIADVRKVCLGRLRGRSGGRAEKDGKGGKEDGEARARRMRKWRSVPRDTRRDCFGRAPISTALWAPGGICGVPYIAARALLLRGSRPRRH